MRFVGLAAPLAAIVLFALPAQAADTYADLHTAEGVPDVAEEAYQLAVRMDGPVAEVTARQTLRNRGRDDHEVIYRFPLPAEAAVTGLSVKLFGGKVSDAIVVDAAAAIDPLADPE